MKALDILICPLDQSPLHLTDKTWICTQNHCYDIARQGYTHLMPVQHKRSKAPGDSGDMVVARRDFLNSQAYRVILDAYCDWCGEYLPKQGVLLDAGCGEGYYLQGLAQTTSSLLIGIDVSKAAIRSASQRDKDIQWLVASNRNMPVKDGSLDVITSLFGFPDFDIFKRKLKQDSHVLLIEAGPQHLIEMRKYIYNDIRIKETSPLLKAEQAGFQHVSDQWVTEKAILNAQQIQNLLLMTPHFFRAREANKRRLYDLNSLEVTIEVVLRTLRVSGG